MNAPSAYLVVFACIKFASIPKSQRSTFSKEVDNCVMIIVWACMLQVISCISHQLATMITIPIFIIMSAFVFTRLFRFICPPLLFSAV